MNAVVTTPTLPPPARPARRRGLVTVVLVVFGIVAGFAAGSAITADQAIAPSQTRASRLQTQLRALRGQVKSLNDQLGSLNDPNILSLPSPDGTVTISYDDREGIDVGRLQTYLDHYYPVLAGVVGKAWQNLDIVIRIDRYQPDPAELRLARCQPSLSQADMTFRSAAVVESNVLAELADAFNGCYSLSDARFEDGIAGAASTLALGSPLPPVPPTISDGPVISNVALATVPAFTAYERAHRGFIAHFRLAVYHRLCNDPEPGSPCQDLSAPPKQLFGLAEQVSPGFTAWFKQHGLTLTNTT